MSEESFKTQNRQLAFALACAGCHFAPLANDGPAVNTYTLGFLREPRQKRLVGGLDIESAGKKLIEMGIPGHVTYCFIRDAVFEEAMAAWDEVVAEFQEAAHDRRDPSLPEVSAKVVAQVLCVAVNSQDEFAKVPFVNKMRQLVSTVTSSTKQVPIPDKSSSGEANKPAPRTVVSGKGKVWTIGASKALKDHLKV